MDIYLSKFLKFKLLADEPLLICTKSIFHEADECHWRNIIKKASVKSKWLYVVQDYIDSMEGATLSGRQASAFICDAGEELVALRKKLAAIESQENTQAANITDELSLV